MNVRALGILAGIIALSTFSGCQTVAPPKAQLTAEDSGTITFAISRPHRGQKINGIGTLEFPQQAKTKYPLVVLVHGTAGVGQREQAWADFFQSKGAATFVLDYFRPRGASSSSRHVPRPPEDVLGALKQLSTHPKIDTGNVAIMGFSNGGSVTALSANFVPESDTNGVIPKAYVMMYGGCAVGSQNMYFAKGANPAVLFIAGEKDAMVGPATCEAAAKNYQIKNGKAVVIPGAYHGFDSYKNVTFNHPQWGTVTMRHDEGALSIARNEVMAVLKQAFSPGTF